MSFVSIWPEQHLPRDKGRQCDDVIYGRQVCYDTELAVGFLVLTATYETIHLRLRRQGLSHTLALDWTNRRLHDNVARRPARGEKATTKIAEYIYRWLLF